MKIFYHIDQDGKCAAYCVRKYRVETGMNKDEIGYYPMNYGWEFPFEDIYRNEEIYIVDFSIEPEDMDKLLEITQNVVWIDHHITAINKYANYQKNVLGIRNTKYAGCKLTEFYMSYISTTRGRDTDRFFKLSESDNRNEFTDSHIDDIMEMQKMFPGYPTIVDYVQDWDLWKFNFPNTKTLHMGIEIQDNEPSSMLWDILTSNSNEVEKMIDIGEAIIKYQEQAGATLCKSYGFVCEFEGYKAYALNISSAVANSDWFDSVDKTDYDILIMFTYNGIDWSYGLRSIDKKCDVSVIAEKYGGGGHPGASGFHHTDLLLKQLEDENGARNNER